jgi:hypothetical protein
MGSFIEINDTLQITKKQGFPAGLDFNKYQKGLINQKDFIGGVFEFEGKTSIRVYQQTPVRVFLVENINDKWLYWGLAHILEIKHDYINKTTSGKFKIIYLYTPDEMKQAFQLVDRRFELDFFQ